jgi:hypothetical protein
MLQRAIGSKRLGPAPQVPRAPDRPREHRRSALWSVAFGAAFAVLWGTTAQGAGPVYRCPGSPVLYTDAISAKEAETKGCRVLEGAPISVIQSAKPRAPAPVATAPAASGSPANRIDPGEQRARDSDARRILDAELKREEQRLAAMKVEFNSGEPERQGNERNFQKYQDRVADMKSAIARKESDIAAIKREMSKMPQ